jgi:hypothetical protein
MKKQMSQNRLSLGVTGLNEVIGGGLILNALISCAAARVLARLHWAFTFWQQVWLWEKRPCLLL